MGAAWQSAGPLSLVPLWSRGVSGLMGDEWAISAEGCFWPVATSCLAGRYSFTRDPFLLGFPYQKTYGDVFAPLREKTDEKLLLPQGCEPVGAMSEPRDSLLGPWWGHSPCTQLALSVRLSRSLGPS